MSTTRQLLRFICAGAIGALLYMFLLFALTEWANMWYLSSSLVAMAASNLLNFGIHKWWTFKGDNPIAVRQQLLHYTYLAIAVFILNTGLLYVLVEYASLWYLVSQVIVTAIVTAISFIVSRWIFVAESG